MRPRGEWDGKTLLRPLLGWFCNELAEVVSRVAIAVVQDPTNRDPAHDRTHVRALLAGDRWLDPGGLARSAAALADAAEALDWAFAPIADARISEEDGVLRVDPADLPREFRRRQLATALARLDPSTPRGPDLDRLLAGLEAGRTATLMGVQASKSGNRWQLSIAPPRRSR